MVVIAAQAMVWSSLSGGSPATPLQMSMLRAAQSSELTHLTFAEERLVQAAQMMAFNRDDRVKEAVAIADALSMSSHSAKDSLLPSDTAMALLAAQAETYLAASEPPNARRNVFKMLECIPSPSVDTTQNARWKYRALGLLAVISALEGEWARAEEALREMRESIVVHGWNPDEFDYMDSVAEAVISFMTWSGERAEAAAPRLKVRAKIEPIAHSLIGIMELTALLIRGNDFGAATMATRIVQGSTFPVGPKLIRDFGLEILAFIELCRREPLRALGFLEDFEATQHHVICPAALQAVAYVQMKQYSRALSVTSGCIKQRTRHNLWFVPLIHLCRALAHLGLGHQARALRDAGQALAHPGGFELAVPFRILPSDDLEALFTLTDSMIPRWIVDTGTFRSALPELGGTPELTYKIPEFTKREEIAAKILATDQSFPEIAEQLYVTSGTVKSQASSVYRKLHVKTREEAVARLEQFGFYEF